MKKVKDLDKNWVSEKSHSSADEGHFDTRKRSFFNTAEGFVTKNGCTFCPKCAIYAAKRGLFDGKSDFASIKNWLRTKKSSARFFHAEPGFFHRVFTFSSKKYLTRKEPARYAKSEIQATFTELFFEVQNF